MLPVSQGYPEDLNHSPWLCSTRHFPCIRQKAGSVCQGSSKKGLSTCSRTCRAAAFEPLHSLSCYSQYPELASSACYCQSFWALAMRWTCTSTSGHSHPGTPADTGLEMRVMHEAALALHFGADVHRERSEGRAETVGSLERRRVSYLKSL